MRKKLLILCEYFPPAERAGGPLRTIEALASALSGSHDVSVITKGYDFLATQPLEGVKLNSWNKRGTYQVYYADRKSLSLKTYLSLFKQIKPDLVFLNSFFSPRFSFLPLMHSLFSKAPILCSPRGELSPEALAMKSLKKKIYLFLTLRIWKSKALFVASSEKEKLEIQQSLSLKSEKCFVGAEPTLDKVHSFVAPTKETNNLSVLFLARLNPIKNLDFAIECVGECENIYLNIYGPINSKQEQEYWESCKRQIKEKKLESRIQYRGPIPNEKVSHVLSQHHLLFAPSASENFGHSILEALAEGRPVLIGDQTPWTEVEKYGAGYAYPLKNKRAFIEALNYLKSTNQQQLVKICQSAQQAAKKLYSNEAAISSWKEILRKM